MKDIIIDLQKLFKRLIQLKFAINFIYSRDINEEQAMHSKSDNIKVITYDNTNNFMKEGFELLFSRYQIGLETSMKGSDFIFDGVITISQTS